MSKSEDVITLENYDYIKKQGPLTSTTATLDITPQTIGYGKNFERIYDTQFKKEVEKWVKKYGGEVRMDRIKVGQTLKGLDPTKEKDFYDHVTSKLTGNMSLSKIEPERRKKIIYSQVSEIVAKVKRQAPEYSHWLERYPQFAITEPKYEQVWSATITPAMRDAILPSRGGKGLPLFEAGAGAALLYDRYDRYNRDKQQKSKP